MLHSQHARTSFVAEPTQQKIHSRNDRKRRTSMWCCPGSPNLFCIHLCFPPKNCHHPTRRRNLVKNPIVFFHFQTNKHEFSNLTQHTNKKTHHVSMISHLQYTLQPYICQWFRSYFTEPSNLQKFWFEARVTSSNNDPTQQRRWDVKPLQGHPHLDSSAIKHSVMEAQVRSSDQINGSKCTFAIYLVLSCPVPTLYK